MRAAFGCPSHRRVTAAGGHGGTSLERKEAASVAGTHGPTSGNAEERQARASRVYNGLRGRSNPRQGDGDGCASCTTTIHLQKLKEVPSSPTRYPGLADQVPVAVQGVSASSADQWMFMNSRGMGKLSN